MRHTALLSRRDLRSRDLNPPIHLDGIAIDYLAAEMQRDFNSERALARGSRPNNRNQVGR